MPSRDIRVILDTNIMYSALLAGGKPAAVLRKVMKHDNGLIGCVSTALLYEYEEILKGKLQAINANRIKLGLETLTYKDIDLMLDTFTACSLQCAISLLTRPSLADPDDEFIMDLAARSGAIICTGNVKDFRAIEAPSRVEVMTPAQLLEMLK